MVAPKTTVLEIRNTPVVPGSVVEELLLGSQIVAARQPVGGNVGNARLVVEVVEQDIVNVVENSPVCLVTGGARLKTVVSSVSGMPGEHVVLTLGSVLNSEDVVKVQPVGDVVVLDLRNVPVVPGVVADEVYVGSKLVAKNHPVGGVVGNAHLYVEVEEGHVVDVVENLLVTVVQDGVRYNVPVTSVSGVCGGVVLGNHVVLTVGSVVNNVA